MADEHDKETIEDGELQRVLRAAGPREQPSAQMTGAVRDAVRAEWLGVVAQRNRRQRRYTVAAALAASVGIASIALWMTRPITGAPEMIASVARTIGDVGVKQGFFQTTHALSERQPLQTGEIVFTGNTGRAALSLQDGTSVRLDYDTRVELANTDRLVVLAGAVYVDTKMGARRLHLETPRGSVRHVGTQYEVRLLGEDVRIRVREGAIELTGHGEHAQHGRAGEELTVSAGGKVERAAIPIYGADWAWTGVTAPAIAINGRPLAEFLSWAGRELGREVVFQSAEDKSVAEGVILSGTIEGLTPTQALEAVMETTQFRSEQRDGHLAIERRPPSN